MIDEARAAADAAREAAKDPLSYPILTYLWVLLISLIGGLVSFIRKVRSGVARWCNLVELIGELITAAFVGVITFLLCEAAGVPPLITSALVGIASHMGTRAIFLFERVFQAQVERRTGISLEDESQRSEKR